MERPLWSVPHGDAARPDSMQVLAWWDDYLAANNRSERTRELYGYVMLRLMRRHLGRHPLDLGEPEVMAFMASLGKRAAARAVYARALRSFYGWAHQRGLIATNPAGHLKPKTPASPPPEAFSPDDVVRLLVAAAWRDPRRAWALLACYALGTRRSELVSIRLEDINWEAGRVYLHRTKGNRPRYVAMGPLAREALAELAAYVGHRGYRPPSGGWVPPHPPGDTRLLPVAPSTLSTWVEQAGLDCGFPPGKRRRSHTLRATFATMLDHNGVPVAVIQRLLGHRSVATTTRYLGVLDDDLRQAVETL
ncbi:MAG TPA: tyrosine-type recombinase/integrase [Actinomycetota bacterium]|nr:tyrosine-type recombinase/integrase [Actinomycetota bacterium]